LRYPFLEFNTRIDLGTTTPDTAAARLSRREREVVALVAEGLTNREIANRLFISERTVDGHLEHIREKLGVNTRAQVAAWFVRQGSETEAPTVAVAPAIARQSPRLVAHPRLWTAAALVLALLAAGVGILRLTAPPPPEIKTIAGVVVAGGGPSGDYTGDGGLATNAALSRPSDVVVAPDGAIYIADYGNSCIRRVAGGIITTVVGLGNEPLKNEAFATGPTGVRLESPSTLALDSAGNLFFLDAPGGDLEVWTLAANSTVKLVASLGHSRAAAGLVFKVPIGGLAIAPDGTMYIADSAGNHVWKRSPNGDTSIYAGDGIAGRSGDHGAAKDAQLWGPMGLALDKSGNLYIADTGNNRIRKVDKNEIITTVAGNNNFYGDGGDGGPATDARLAYPFGIAVAKDGTIYIADTGNNRVRKVSTNGTIEAVAGTGQRGFWGDGGSALEAGFLAPEAVTLDAKGDLLIVDTGNHRVREIPGIAT